MFCGNKSVLITDKMSLMLVLKLYPDFYFICPIFTFVYDSSVLFIFESKKL